MKAAGLLVVLALAGCTFSAHESYDATLTYRVTPWAATDPAHDKAAYFLLERVPKDEPAPIKPADTEFLPRDQAPPGTAVGDLLRCSVHQERDTMNVAAADASEKFGPCDKV